MPRFVWVLCLFMAATICAAQDNSLLLLQKPALSRTQIIFVYAGDLWSVPREGGDAKRLTTGAGVETDPMFSPDGTQIAFTGEYDGNVDVFVMPAEGGFPKRLTHHPGDDIAVGWTPDGKQVLFRSARNSFSYFDRLFTAPVQGGFPAELPLPMAQQGSFSPDGSRIAYVPIAQWQQAWKRYRGGQTTPEDSSGQFQRLQPYVGGRQNLLPVRPGRAGEPVFVRYACKGGQEGAGESWTGSEVSFRRSRCHCLRAVWLFASLRFEVRHNEAGECPDSRRPA